MAPFSIKSGPSKFDLMTSLMDSTAAHPRTVVFEGNRLYDHGNGIATMLQGRVLSVGVEDGSGESWLVRFQEADGTSFDGYYSTRSRTGHLSIDEGRPARFLSVTGADRVSAEVRTIVNGPDRMALALALFDSKARAPRFPGFEVRNAFGPTKQSLQNGHLLAIGAASEDDGDSWIIKVMMDEGGTWRGWYSTSTHSGHLIG
jgi:hypothetical protein